MDPVLEELNQKLKKIDINKLTYELNSLNPDDGKYANDAEPLRKYLTAAAEWKACAKMQYLLPKCESNKYEHT